MSEHVRVEANGPVLAITLARPERRNAITVAMYAALADAIEQAPRDPSIRVITFRGEGQDFAAGNDLADFLTRCRATRGNPGVAVASGARRMRDPDRRRGSRQLRRHRHDDAAPLRPGHRRGKGAFLAAVRRSCAWCPKRRARCCFRALPGAGARRDICCSREPFGVDEAHGHRPRQPSRRTRRARSQARRDRRGAARQAGRGAAADAAAAAHAARGKKSSSG